MKLEKTVSELLKNIKPSPPLFEVTLVDEGCAIEVRPLKATNFKALANTEDPVENLVYSNIEEYFNVQTERFEINKDTVLSHAYMDIANLLCVFLTRNLESTKPNQTKLFKWLKYVRLNNNSTTSDGLTLLYSYLYKHAGCNMTFTKGDVHAKNGILILERIKEIDEKSKS